MSGETALMWAASNSEDIVNIRNLILVAEGNDLPPTYEKIERKNIKIKQAKTKLNDEKWLFKDKLKFDRAKEVNAMGLQNKPSTSGY